MTDSIHGRRGFTLIETLVAMTAIALLLAGALAAFGRAAQALAAARDSLRFGWQIQESRSSLELEIAGHPSVLPAEGRFPCPAPFDDLIAQRSWQPFALIPAGPQTAEERIVLATLRVGRTDSLATAEETRFLIFIPRERP